MALEFAKGIISWAAGEATGAKSVSGLAFQPKAVIFFGATTQTTGSYVADHDAMLGCATSSSQEWVVHSTDNNQTVSTTCARGASATACIRNSINGVTGATPDFEADFTSMDASGFTVNLSNSPSVAVAIHYLAIGGSDITNAKAGSFTIPTSGAINITDPGFQPDMVLFGHSWPNGTNYRISMGTATASGSQGGTFVGGGTGSATVSCGNQQRSDNVLSTAQTSSISQDMLVAFSAFTASGFDLTASDYPGGATTAYYLAIKGGQWKAGAETEGTSAAAKDTSLAFSPSGLFLFGWNLAASATYSTTTDALLSIGATDGTNEGCIWGGNDDANVDSPAFKRHDTGRAFWHADPATVVAGPPTTRNEADATLGASKFTLTWTQAGISRQFIYLAGGSSGAPTHNLAGEIAFDPVLDGAQSRSTSLVGDIVLSPTLDGAQSRSTSLVGDIALNPALDGLLGRTTTLTGEIGFDPALDGLIARGKSLTGEIDFSPALDGLLARTTSLAGDIDLSPTLDGLVTRTTFLVGDIAYAPNLDGDIVVTGGAVTYALTGELDFSPALDGLATRTSFLVGEIAFDPALDALLGRTSFLVGDVVLAFDLDGAITVTAVPEHFLAGDILFTPALDALLGRTSFLAGDLVLAPALDGLLIRSTGLSGEIMYVPGLDGSVGFLASVIPGDVAVADTDGTGILVVDTTSRTVTVSEQTGPDVSVTDTTLATVEVE